MPDLDRSRSTATHVFAQTAFGTLPSDVQMAMLQGASTIQAEAGVSLFTSGDKPFCGILTEGLLRVYATSGSGRQVTIRYSRPGSIVGLSAILRVSPYVNVQALSRSTLLRLNDVRLREIVRKDPRVGWAALTELTDVLNSIAKIVAEVQFASIEQRLAHHLLDLSAVDVRSTGSLTAHVTNQQLADAIGTAREVIVRELRTFRAKGLIRTSRRGIEIVDLDGLAKESSTAEGAMCG